MGTDRFTEEKHDSVIQEKKGNFNRKTVLSRREQIRN